MKSREKNDVTSNKLLGVIYVLLYWVSQAQRRALRGQLDTVWHSPLRQGAGWALPGGRDPPWPVGGNVGSWITHASSQGRLQVPSKGSLDRMFRVLWQMMNIQQGQANPILCVPPREITPCLPVILGSPACIRQFGDETFLGEWMSWQMLSAGNLLKRQLVRGYCSCSVEHSWFTPDGLKMWLSKMCFAKLFKAIK